MLAHAVDAQTLSSAASTYEAHNPEGGCIPPDCIPPPVDSVTITLMPGLAARLIYTDAQGLTTQFDFPANTVTETMVVDAQFVQAAAPRADFISTGHAFVLYALRNSNLDKGFSFGAPVTVTIQYSDNDIHGMNEKGLMLYWWSGWNWRYSTLTCTPPLPYHHDSSNNVISLAICELGQHGLFSTWQSYAPLVMR